ncbi:chitin synthase 6 [Uncinocarpus reesii 1704]|uniref:chitin synthase n=1 Tax=Uncinocarpus reesii (strain UAMH 1704) TaxID=336963 RepID=C4JVE3_UNCRE|nr:chitin synthase 6 [Uncinocarpus reesii 1704]EEP81670.1 chitin synthase 6 [Uncinocarpus reesii 1704]
MAANPLGAAAPSHAQSSLPSLPQHLQTDTQLTAHLASRGPDGLKEGSAMGEAEDLAKRAWTRLGSRGENQAVVFLGESGSGKTTIRSHLLSSLLSYSSTPLSTKLSLAAFVFDTLTTTKTVTTPTASKAGLFFELQYDGSSTVNPTLIGGKLLDHRLERSRIASVPTGERSFHVLYYLLAGTSPAERTHLGLDSSGEVLSSGPNKRSSGQAAHKRWRYLGHPTQLKVGINDAEGFQHFKTALRKLEFPRSEIAEICQILASILHIGQLEFTTGQATRTGADESGGYSHEGGETVTVVKNRDVLSILSAFLGLSVDELETSLGYKTKTIHKERVTVMLDPKGARANADGFARTLYALLVAYVIENINQRVCATEDAIANTISIVDFPGFAQASTTNSTLDQLLNNAATESLYHYCLQNFFERKADMLETEEVNVPATSYFDNSDAVKGLLKHGNGLLSILDDQTKRARTDMQFLESIRKRFENKNSAIAVGSSTAILPGSNFATQNAAAVFTVKHFAGEVDYPVKGLIEENGDLVSGDLLNLLNSTKSGFVRELFGQEALQMIRHPKEKNAIMQAQPNDRRIANQFDSKCVRTQVQTLGIAEISQRLRNADFSVFLPFAEFLGLAEAESVIVGSDKEKSQLIVDEKRWPTNEACIGSTGVFLSERCWADLARIGERVHPSYSGGGTDDGRDNLLHVGGNLNGDSKVRLLPSGDSTPGAFIYGDDKQGYFGSRELDARSDAGASAFNSGDMFKNLETREQMAERSNEKQMVEVEDVIVSGSRKRWLALVYLLTFYVPDFMIRLVGRMKRKDVRIAWREKFAINLLIWLSCGFVVFVIVLFPRLICPTQHVYSAAELSSHDGKDNHAAYTAIRGEVFDLGSFIPAHYPGIVPEQSLLKYAGIDATHLFPVQVSALCKGKGGDKKRIDPSVLFDFTPTNISGSASVVRGNDQNFQYHDFRAFTNDTRPTWYAQKMRYLRANYKKGELGYTMQHLKTLSEKSQYIAVLKGTVYDLTNYMAGGRYTKGPDGKPKPGVDVDFLDSGVVQLFQQKSGHDITEFFNRLPLSTTQRYDMEVCLNNLFKVGQVDTRNSTQCLFSQYFVLAISALLASIIGFKFLAALQFGRKNIPENLDKFIICQVPAYTEDEESLRRAMDSMARMKYDDKRKLLVVICDGMIIGQGNDRPTPRIVLDILGVPDTVDPEPLSFESLGEGMRQHNMGKVYSGLYEVQGHIVPFLVVVKVGKPSEVSRPGNRGKRDSQMLLMRFLNRVHYNAPMSPLELEMHHQIRNIIGVNPTFYEFILQVDADTVVASDSATRMVASFLADTRVIGLCGETALNNAKSSMITMIQVYEYWISHNLTKAFESLFGSVTCLPGCFTMFRIRAADTGKPLFVSKEVVDSYGEIRVDTLHMKNLLHLGEDRYLTTLLLKHHPKYKTKYIFNAHAWTIAPDSWAVFLSQRRRWINSTVHNLIELIPLQQLCGFCCFSMRFVVFVDLLSTVIQPVTVAYVVYLIVLVSLNPGLVPVTAFILLGAIYGLQGLIFILRRLPLYAFWHMDDFTWGNTRIVTGEKGRKIVITDEGKFDPASIPKKKWEEYQAELWEAQTHRDDQSEVSGYSYRTKSYHPAMSEYGYPAARPASQLDYNRHSRMSLPASELLGRNSDLELTDFSGLPTDDALLAEIRDILRTADLMTVTKKSVKQELERRFNINLDAKRAYINSVKRFFPILTQFKNYVSAAVASRDLTAVNHWMQIMVPLGHPEWK